jgi:hypothetical protein
MVPAGSWLARQFLERHRAWLAGLPDRMRTLGAHTQQSIVWEQPGGRAQPGTAVRLLASDDRKIFSWLFVPAGSTHLLIRADFDGGARHGQVVVTEIDWHDQPVGDARTFLIEPSGEQASAAVLMPLQPDLFRIWLGFGGSPDGGAIVLRNIRVDFLEPRQGEDAPPSGAVGAIYHQEDKIPELARDMVRHYPHYLRTAEEFARDWRACHNADRLVRKMTEVAGLDTSVEPAPPALSSSVGR